MAGPCWPEGDRGGFERQSADTNRPDHAGSTFVLTLVSDRFFRSAFLRLIVKPEDRRSFRSERKCPARSSVKRSFQLLSVDENRIDEHAAVVAKRHGDLVYGIRLLLNSGIPRLKETTAVQYRLLDLTDS